MIGVMGAAFATKATQALTIIEFYRSRSTYSINMIINEFCTSPKIRLFSAIFILYLLNLKNQYSKSPFVCKHTVGSGRRIISVFDVFENGKFSDCRHKSLGHLEVIDVTLNVTSNPDDRHDTENGDTLHFGAPQGQLSSRRAFVLLGSTVSRR